MDNSPINQAPIVNLPVNPIPPNQIPPTSPAKKSHLGLILGLSIGGVIVVALIVVLIVILANNGIKTNTVIGNAVSSLNASQRDTSRRQDVGRITSALQAFSADNGNDVASVTESNLKEYIGSDLQILSGFSIDDSLKFNNSNNISDYNPTTSAAVVILGKTCLGLTMTDGTDSDAAVVVKLESDQYYCVSM